MTDPKGKAENYSDELKAQLLELYDGGKGKTVAEIATILNKTPKSVIGKLTHMGVYVKATPVVKTRADEGPSKKDLLGEFKALGFSETVLNGLGNATKPALAEVLERLGVNSGAKDAKAA